MKICDVLKQKRTLSFEFYPPKSAEGLPFVFNAIERLKVFRPDFISVTHGAGGTTRSLTEEIVVRVKKETNLLPMAHLTCVGQTREEVHGTLARLGAEGLENVIALRGDLPRGETRYVPVTGSFAHATDLLRHIRRHFKFGLAAACYPEGHTESPDLETDMDFTRRKVEAGADFLITQLFYDNTYFFDFLDRARKANVNVPILAGILPILNTAQVRRFTALCGATIPPALDKELDRRAHDDDAVRRLGIDYATKQVRELWNNGVDGIHFYALNRSYSISEILKNLGFLDPSHVSLPQEIELSP